MLDARKCLDAFTIFTKSSVLDASLGSECASDFCTFMLIELLDWKETNCNNLPFINMLQPCSVAATKKKHDIKGNENLLPVFNDIDSVSVRQVIATTVQKSQGNVIICNGWPLFVLAVLINQSTMMRHYVRILVYITVIDQYIFLALSRRKGCRCLWWWPEIKKNKDCADININQLIVVSCHQKLS